MKLRNILLGLSLIAAGIFFIFYGWPRLFGQPETSAPASGPAGNAAGLETRYSDEGGVSVEAAPVKLDADQPWEFQITLDTHSGSLDDDLVKQSLLVDDLDHYYPPLRWEGSEPGGHHRAGKLIFNPVKPYPQYFEIKIRDVGGIAERTFRWDLH